jgi:type IX secretion system PorP/SprF family membrane protein
MLHAQNDSSNPTADWRQHNVLKYNRNLFNPTFSFAGQEGRDLSIWSRIQWIGIENSPKTYVINYSGKISDNAGAGLALFQQNLGLFTDSGVLINYARGIQLSRNSWLTFALNASVFRRGLDENAFVTPVPDPALLDNKDDFIMTFMPGINVTIGNFDFGITSENLYDYNLTEGTTVSDFSDKSYAGHVAYKHPINARGGMMKNASLTTLAYGKTLPNHDAQVGVNAILNLPEHGWLQAGYNSVFGVSGGLGVKVGNGFGVGFVVETGTQSSNSAFGATYEFTAAIELGVGRKKEKRISFDGPSKDAFKKEEKLVETAETKINKAKDSVKLTETQKASTQTVNTIVKEENKEHEAAILDANSIQQMDIKTLDSLGINKDSDQAVLKQVFNENAPNKRYQVVDRIEGVDYGFYLVVNVFAQKKYFDLFIKFLTQRNLSPKYFYNNENKYYYVYLKKYDKLSEIESARRTRYNGRYFGDTWILWVKNN